MEVPDWNWKGRGRTFGFPPTQKSENSSSAKTRCGRSQLYSTAAERAELVLSCCCWFRRTITERSCNLSNGNPNYYSVIIIRRRGEENGTADLHRQIWFRPKWPWFWLIFVPRFYNKKLLSAFLRFYVESVLVILKATCLILNSKKAVFDFSHKLRGRQILEHCTPISKNQNSVHLFTFNMAIDLNLKV